MASIHENRQPAKPSAAGALDQVQGDGNVE